MVIAKIFPVTHFSRAIQNYYEHLAMHFDHWERKNSSASTMPNLSSEPSRLFVTSTDVFGQRIGVFNNSNPRTQNGNVSNTNTLVQPIEPVLATTRDHLTEGVISSNQTLSPTDSEQAFTRIKHFSSQNSYYVANAIRDSLKDIVGESEDSYRSVDDEFLSARRRSFFETLFHGVEDLSTAQPCRFSLNDIDALFSEGATGGNSLARNYKGTTDAIHDLGSTLGL